MAASAHSPLLLRLPRNRVSGYLIALGAVAGATLLRLALDPVLQDQLPYVVYVAAVVVATWFAGAEAGVVSTVFGALAGNYFFITPRHTITLGAAAIALLVIFAAVSLGIVAFVAQSRRAETDLRQLHAKTAAVLEQMPVCVAIAGADGEIQYCNSAFSIMVGRPMTSSTSVADYRKQNDYSPLRPDGSLVQPDDTAIQRALRGVTTRDEELHMVWPDGRRRIVSASGAPLLDDRGQIAGAVLAAIDITERKRIEADLLRREQELSAATLAAEVGVWTWTPGTNSVSVGANWRGLFGVAPDADVGFQTWAGALHPDDRERAVETLNAAWRDRQEFSVEYRVLRPDGSVRWIIDRGRATYDASGNATGMAGINIDITKRKEAEEALRDADRLKDEFLATLSHELRTPLNAIVGWADMLRRGNLPPEHAQRATESIYRNAKVQNDLINDVLDVSRIISGKVRLDTQPVDPALVLQSAVESVQAGAEAKGVAIVTDLGAVPFPVAGDSTRLQQVFWNLLSNAVKYTPPGGHVRVSLRYLNGVVRVQVADNGAGISPDFLPHVFERFRQRDSSITRTQGGLGLGLAIVRHFVELHGGTVGADSAGEGHGAEFTVTLPAQRFEERRHGGPSAGRRVSPPAIEAVPDDVPSLCGVRVLVVDDEDDARDVAASVLRHHGASVAVAANAAQALEQFGPFDPDVLLVDLAMPDIDGYTLMARIRESGSPKGATVPAIALTAYAREEDQRRALASGFQLHLPKPVDSHALVRTVASVQQAPSSGRQQTSDSGH